MKPNLDFQTIASQGNAVLGIRGSGKTYTGTWLAEQFLDRGIPFVAFDPIGVWRYLKVPGAGKGYKVVVAGGEHGDLPLTPESAVEIVRASMSANVPLVLDLYSMELSKADWKRIVESALKVLLYENKKCGLRHIFIEEAAEFCPQRIGPDQGRVYDQVERLARMGGNASLGYTLINQRAEEVNKAVLELCDCLFLHRQKGRNSLTALEKWLAFADPKMSDTITCSLPALEAGHCWIWSEGSTEPKRVIIPKKNSFHPDRKNPETAKASSKAIDVGDFVSQLKETITVTIEENKANDPAVLRKRIADLEKELDVARKSQAPTTPPGAMNAMQGVLNEAIKMHSHCENLLDDIKALSEKLKTAPANPTMAPVTFYSTDQRQTIGRAIENPNPDWRPIESNGVAKLEREILVALAQNPSGLNAVQIALRVGKSSKGGYFLNTLSKMRTAGLISGMNSHVSIMNEGKKVLGPFDPLPTGRALLDKWVRELDKLSGEILKDVYGQCGIATTAHDVAARIGKESTGGYFLNTLSKLRTLGLIVGSNKSMNIAPDFFK